MGREPSKSGSRQPLFKEVLESASFFGHAQLVIEVKPGGGKIAEALVAFFKQYPLFLSHVAAIMSFDQDVVFRVAELWPPIFARPNLLLLTIKKSSNTAEPYERLLDFNSGDVREEAERLITRGKLRLDGVYSEWNEKMPGRDMKHWIQKLAEQMIVGIWQNKGEPDTLEMCTLFSGLGVSFVNTDLPHGFGGNSFDPRIRT